MMDCSVIPALPVAINSNNYSMLERYLIRSPVAGAASEGVVKTVSSYS